MIVKMKFLSITGPKADIDRVVEQYLSKYEIHLENALSELKTVQNLTPYIQINPYKEKLKLAEDYTGLLPEDARKTGKPMTLESAINCIQETDRVLAKLKPNARSWKQRETGSGSCPSRSNRFRICPAAFPRCWTSGSSSSGSARFRKTIIRNLKIISMKIQSPFSISATLTASISGGSTSVPKTRSAR